MTSFIELQNYSFASKVLIFGSYKPNKIDVLIELKQILIDKNFINTYLASDLTDTPQDISYEQKMSIIYGQIKKLINEFDYHIFLLFDDENESALIELSTVLNCPAFSERTDKILVLLPKNLNISMLIGMLTLNGVCIFRYRDISEIFDYTYSMIK
jgi:hypothetical protein